MKRIFRITRPEFDIEIIIGRVKPDKIKIFYTCFYIDPTYRGSYQRNGSQVISPPFLIKSVNSIQIGAMDRDHNLLKIFLPGNHNLLRPLPSTEIITLEQGECGFRWENRYTFLEKWLVGTLHKNIILL